MHKGSTFTRAGRLLPSPAPLAARAAPAALRACLAAAGALLLGLGAACPARAGTPDPSPGVPLHVKVVVVATFEYGADTGDAPGEFQAWAEREHFTRKISVPGMDHVVYANDEGELGVVSGTTVRCSNQLMALGLDPRFDFSRAYWMLDGIAGVDPAVGSLAGAAWARYVVDGDVAYEVDSTEVPAGWPYGVFPIGGKRPNDIPHSEGWEPRTMAWPLNPALVQRAFELTRHVAIPDSAPIQALRARFKGFPTAQKPPFVFIGDVVGSCRFWQGAVMTRWARDWTALWTGGKGVFAMTAMEDQGFAAAMTTLSHMGRVDFGRVLVLRAASDYCLPPPGSTPVESMLGSFPGYRPACESCYVVGSVVVHDIMNRWDAAYRDGVR